MEMFEGEKRKSSTGRIIIHVHRGEVGGPHSYRIIVLPLSKIESLLIKLASPKMGNYPLPKCLTNAHV